MAQDVSDVEALLMERAKAVVEVAVESVEGKTSEEAKNVANGVMKNFDLLKYFESYLEIAVEHLEEDPKFEGITANIIGMWVEITREDTENYICLSGNERDEFVRTLYCEKLSQR